MKQKYFCVVSLSLASGILVAAASSAYAGPAMAARSISKAVEALDGVKDVERALKANTKITKLVQARKANVLKGIKVMSKADLLEMTSRVRTHLQVAEEYSAEIARIKGNSFAGAVTGDYRKKVTTEFAEAQRTFGREIGNLESKFEESIFAGAFSDAQANNMLADMDEAVIGLQGSLAKAKDYAHTKNFQDLDTGLADRIAYQYRMWRYHQRDAIAAGRNPGESLVPPPVPAAAAKAIRDVQELNRLEARLTSQKEILEKATVSTRSGSKAPASVAGTEGTSGNTVKAVSGK